MNCIDGMNEMIMQNLKVDLFVTSPPYYNAREYSQWETVNDYRKLSRKPTTLVVGMKAY